MAASLSLCCFYALELENHLKRLKVLVAHVVGRQVAWTRFDRLDPAGVEVNEGAHVLRRRLSQGAFLLGCSFWWARHLAPGKTAAELDGFGLPLESVHLFFEV